MPSPSFVSEQQSVCNVQNCKRLNPYDTTQDGPPAKRIKSTTAVRVASNFSPKFWDNLSKVWLTPRALREKDRRNGVQFPATVLAASVIPTTLARFARHGGLDLRHLRGYPEPKQAARISSNRSSAPSSRRTQSTKATTVSSKAKRSSAYDRDFEQKLIDHNIYPKGHEYPDDVIPEPGNLNDITQTLVAPRGSLSPSRFDQAAFKAFTLANDRVISEGNVMAKILPAILGDADLPSEGNLPFTNLASITDGTTVDAIPNLYDGVYPKDVDRSVRQDLNDMIIPTTHGRAPAVPNFFVEAKAPRGGADVAKRQACLDGAIGARAMHSLQTYGEGKPSYDGNAHAFSSTYHDGTLKIYTHHVTAPRAEGDRAEYHMTQLKAYALTSDREAFVQGVTAFRNARDLARRQPRKMLEGQVGTMHLMCPGSIQNSRDSHDDLQQQIADNHVEHNDDDGEVPSTPQHHDSSDESVGPGQDPAASAAYDPSMSFVSSFTSSFNTETTHPKRSRQSLSSPTQSIRSSKSRSRPTASQGFIQPSSSTTE
ncbi:hypothetical protein NOR_01796 [Metarhizium rileyi]|uniref:DUF7924 domain-containing protein n=1 Tax=Metarhizium rileyi (strain RCEF 4871) TaxID=1649241 RepID=A0A167I0Z2_METRR|nr:hypothetical protein NOR_01796 [Metarhizium rileyi RCEF 4871]